MRGTLKSLVDDVYIANYKLSGQAFWCPVAYVEQCLFDLIGKTVKKTAAELMGGVLRKEVPVYLSGSGRETYGGGRSRSVRPRRGGDRREGGEVQDRRADERQRGREPGRTDKLLELAQKKLAGKVTLMADANGSYSAAKAIEIGEAPPGDEVSILRGAVPVGGDERDEEGGRRARNQDRVTANRIRACGNSSG